VSAPEPAPARRAQETIYFTRDLDAAVKFHVETLGFRLEKRFEWGFALLSPDGTKGLVGLMDVSLCGEDPGEDGALPRPRLSIQVADLDGELRRLHALGVVTGDVGGTRGGHRAVDCYDPEGNPYFLWEDGSGKV
jgi:catechol 2,3-dioxygenase-like lactoylglutathione lyase family enzyme